MKTTQDSTQPVPEAPVDRFNPRVVYYSGGGGCAVSMDAVPDGLWVRYEDYEKLRQAYVSLLDRHHPLTDVGGMWEGKIRNMGALKLP